MSGEMTSERMLAPLGTVEPHGSLLTVPVDNQLLYKVMTPENLLASIEHSYLHFNRVDSYADFPDADEHDGEQLAKDRPGNSTVRFEKTPEFSLADYYNQSRSRTYACCFSLENSDFIWDRYANGSARGKVVVVFEFGKLRATLNRNLQAAILEYNGIRCRQVFSLSYGIVQYVDWHEYQSNTTTLPNPIIYTYLKDMERFSSERELRVSLSTIGMGHFALNDGSLIQFPPSLRLSFDFRAALADATIYKLLHSPSCDVSHLEVELAKMHIFPANK